MKKILAFLLAAMLLLSIVGCAAQTQSDAQPAAAEPAADTSQPTQDSVSAADGDTVTIGYYLPLSGANATDSPYYLNAINLAIKKINAEGGLNGKQIVTASYDTTSSTEEAAKVATKLVTVDKISICISSPMSSEVLASSKTLNDAGVFTMVMGISSALLDPESFEYGFRGSFNTDNTIPACLNMIDTLGAKSVAILFSQGDASITNATQFRDQSTELGYDCTAFETFDLGEMDYQICEAGLSRTYQVINLSWKMTALENILVGMHSNLKSTFWQSLFHTKFQREEEQAALARARELLDFVGLRDRENELASSLSYGEQQMLAIGRALINRPKLMILDEPWLGLAPSTIREIFESIKRINAEGTTILFVEQNARIALATAQRGYVLQAGKIELTDTCEKLISNEEVQRIYLGTN